MLGLIILVGIFQSWNVALSIFNMCLISAVMTMGANIQWGYAGLINFGLMGYAALGGLAAVLISVEPVQEAWVAGGFSILMSLWLIVAMVLAIRFVLKNFEKSKIRTYGIASNYHCWNCYYKSYIRDRALKLLKALTQQQQDFLVD